MATGERLNTPASAPDGLQVLTAPSAPHDGITVMPGSPTGHGRLSPKLQTVLVAAASAAVSALLRVMLAGTPEWPTVTLEGKLIDVPAAMAADAGAAPRTTSPATRARASARGVLDRWRAAST